VYRTDRAQDDPPQPVAHEMDAVHAHPLTCIPALPLENSLDHSSPMEHSNKIQLSCDPPSSPGADYRSAAHLESMPFIIDDSSSPWTETMPTAPPFMDYTRENYTSDVSAVVTGESFV